MQKKVIERKVDVNVIMPYSKAPLWGKYTAKGQYTWSLTTGCVISNRGFLKFNKKGNNSQNENNKFMKD